MAVLNPHHLIDQAELLRAARASGKPRQVDLRRAISAAYYAVFQQVLTSVADEFVGKGSRSEERYRLVYRSIDHSAIRRTCREASRQNPNPKYQKFLPNGGFEEKIRDFSNAFIRLQTLRHEADYDPAQYFSSVDALFAVYLAEQAINDLTSAIVEDRRLFLTFLIFEPR